ncbi:MAG: hypothetical protein FJX76_15775 [Armatimonadetes bacterium]|nr:hypothetical protein [Armatimonadota bacterium]
MAKDVIESIAEIASTAQPGPAVQPLQTRQEGTAEPRPPSVNTWAASPADRYIPSGELEDEQPTEEMMRKSGEDSDQAKSHDRQYLLRSAAGAGPVAAASGLKDGLRHWASPTSTMQSARDERHSTVATPARAGAPEIVASDGSRGGFTAWGPREGGPPSLSLEPGELLRPGSQGDKVRSLQELLKSRGANLEVDGEFGPQTRRAVLDFQAKNGLATDGIVGPDTLGALVGARPSNVGSSSLQQDVMGRARSIGGQINATGGYRFDGYNDCYGFLRRVWDPVLQSMGKGKLPIDDGPNSANWGRISSWDHLRPGDVLATAQGHFWGANWHGGLYAGKINGVHYIYDNSGSLGAQMRPVPYPGYFTSFHRPTHDLLGGS